MPSDERSLVEHARSDPEAFGRLYDRHVAAVYRMSYARLGNASAAEDVTAEVFIKALRAIGSYREQGRPFRSWLYQITRNEVANHFRHQRPTCELGPALADHAIPVETHAIRDLEIEGIWQLVDRLPRQQRRAMILRFHDDRSDRETGQIMGKSEAAVKLLIYRAVSRLRSELAEPAPGRAPARSALAAS